MKTATARQIVERRGADENVCPRCGGDGFVLIRNVGYRCGCVRRKIEAIRRAGIPPYERRELSPFAKNYVDDFDAIARSAKNWLALMGKTGSGKSTQAFGIAERLIRRENSVPTKIVVYNEIVRELSALRFRDDDFSERFKSLIDVELLVVDDFLDVVPKLDSFDEQVALTLIKRRYDVRKPTILTTELTPKRLAAALPVHGEAILGRIVEMCDGRISVAGSNAVNYRLAELSR